MKTAYRIIQIYDVYQMQYCEEANSKWVNIGQLDPDLDGLKKDLDYRVKCDENRYKRQLAINAIPVIVYEKTSNET